VHPTINVKYETVKAASIVFETFSLYQLGNRVLYMGYHIAYSTQCTREGWRERGRMGLGHTFFWGAWSPLLNFEFCLYKFKQHNWY